MKQLTADEKLRGQIAITEETVKGNRMGWNVFDFFNAELERLVGVKMATRCGWYARKEKDGIHYFLWQEFGTPRNEKYLTALKNDGWSTI